MKKITLLFILIFISRFSVYAQTYLLNEDFATATDTTPPAGWNNYVITGTTTDKWHFDNPGNRIINFPISPKFAIFDSDNYSQGGGPEKAILESKTFDASVAPDILLKFDHYFVGGRGGAGYVDVYNGTTWNNVAQFIDSTTNPESKVIDISAFAGGVPDCKIRFRWEGDSSYYWAVDNIRVIAPLLYDLALTKIDSPITQVTYAGLQPVVINLKNFGFNTITTATINWSVNNVIQPAFTWNGSLPIDSFQNNITIGSYNFLARWNYNITVWISAPNGHADLNTQNDTLVDNVTLYGPLCGTYTVGGFNPDFNEIADVTTALHYGGVSCAVLFNIRNGVYYEGLTLDTIPGVSATNTITFQSESGDSSLVAVVLPVNVYNTNYVTLQKMEFNKPITVTNSGWLNIFNSRLDFGFVANNPAGPIMVQQNYVKSTVHIGGGSYVQSAISNNIFSINAAVNAILVTMTSSTMALTIENNNFSFYSTTGCVSVSNSVSGTSILILNNYFSGGGAYGIQISGAGNYSVSQNFITHFSNGISNSSTSNTLIANNIIATTNNGIANTGANCTIVFNSIYLIGSNNNSSAFSTNNSINQTVLNNVFANMNLGYAVYCTAASIPTGCNWNNNDYYSYKRKTGYFVNDRNSLNDWQLSTNQDSASQGVNPFYYASSTTMAINQVRLNDAGVPIAGITTDYFGTVRGVVPDMGAVEYTPCAVDAGINEITGLPTVNVVDTILPIQVYLQNQGTQPLTSVIIHFQVDGNLQPTYNWTGNLNYKDSVKVVVGTYHFQFQNFNSQTINSWTELPNGIADCDVTNDASASENVTVKKTLCGTYTVGGMNSDFLTTDEVATDLNLGDISCPVIFNIRNGVYNGMTINNVVGSSSVNTITFQSETADSNNVTLGFLQLKGTKYINFHQLEIVSHSANPLILADTAGWVTFSNCILSQQGSFALMNSMSPTGPFTINNNNIYGSPLLINGGSYSESKIINNIISECKIAITLSPSTLLFKIDDNIITSLNTIIQLPNPGTEISVSSAQGTQSYLRRNIINAGALYGFDFSGSGVVDASANRIENSYVGIRIGAATNSLPDLIYNNFVQSYKTGIYDAGLVTRIQYNSVNIIDTISNSSAFQFVGSSSHVIENNIFANNGTGYAIYSTDSALTSGLTINNNDYFTLQSYVGFLHHPVQTFSDWKNATNQDSSSQGVNPFYTSATDLTPNQVRLNNDALTLSNINTDVDSTVRGPLPDIGAKEFSPCINDAGINSISGLPISVVPAGLEPVHVMLQNQGTTTLTSVLIKWSVDGVLQAPSSWIGNLNYGDSIKVSLGNYNFQFNSLTPQVITAWTEIPNGISDCNHFNDTSKTSVLVKETLCGIYTVGGLNPDFNSIKEVADDLNFAGISCAVTFNIRDGNYINDVTLDSILGSSSVNTITFQSESGDSSHVTLTGNLLLNGTKYITFQKIGVFSGSIYAINCLNGSGWININHSIVTDNYNSNSIYAMNPSGPITIQNNSLTGGVTVQNGIYTESDITDNVITAGAGINLALSPTSLLVNVFRNKIIGYSNSVVATADSGAQVLIKNNSISGSGGPSILLNGGKGYFEVSANKISNCAIGITVSNYSANTFIYNNFIQATQYGIFNSAPRIKIIFNSINCVGSGSNFAAIRTNDSLSQIIKNNILESSGSGYSLYFTGTVIPTGSDWDFNDFYSVSGNVGFFINPKTSLASWQSATGKDPNSKDLNPLFLTPTELRPQNRLLNGAAVSYPGILVDIDGDLRNQSAPDVGADEFIVDLGITDLIYPSLDCSHSPEDPVTIDFGQFGDIPFTNIVVAYSVNNGTVYTDTIPGTITNGMVYTFSHSVNMLHYGYYLFKIWIVNNHDDNINNDTLITMRVSKPSPLVSFTYVSQCADANMQFSGTASVPYGYVAKYVWDFGDGGSDTIPVTSHRYDSSGVYFVSLYAYNNYGCYSQYSMYVTVNPTPIPIFSTNNVCVNTPVVFTNQSSLSSGTMSYLWDFGNGTTSTDSIPNISYPSGGQYIITLHVSNTNGCSDTLSKVITVHDLPVINFPSIGPLCTNGSPVYITGATPQGGIYNGNFMVNRYFDPSVSGPGNFILSYSANNSFGCTNTVYDTVNVQDPVYSIITEIGNTEFCFGDSVTLQSNAAASYLWSTGDTTQSIVIKNSGEYFVTAFNQAGCGFISDPVSIIVHGTGNTVVINSSICSGTNYILPDGSTVNMAGNYISTLQSQFGCDSVIQTNLIVNVADTSYINTSICQGSSYSFNGTNYSSAGIYYYTLPNANGCDSVVVLNLSINNTSTSSINSSICQGDSYSLGGNNYSLAGVYTATFTNANGCDSIVTLNLSVNSNSLAASIINYSSNSVSPNTNVILSVSGGILGTNANWKWYSSSCGGISIGTGNSIVVSPAISTTYFVRAEGICDTTNCVSTTITVINCQPATAILSSDSDNIICNGSAVILSAIGGILSPGADWVWHTGSCTGTVIGTGDSITVTPMCTTTYFVKAQGGICNATSCISVTVTVLPNHPNQPGAINGPVNGLCNNQNVIYSVTSVPGATSYTWTVPNTVTIVSGQGTNSIAVNFGGGCSSSGTICVKSNNQCGSSCSSCISYSLIPQSPCPITGPSLVCKHQSGVIYSVSPVNGNVSYSWSVPNATIVTGQGTNTITVNFSCSGGDVKVKATNACGSSAYCIKSVGFNCRFDGDSVEDDVVLYPNPTRSTAVIYFSGSDNEKYLILITNKLGQEIYRNEQIETEGTNTFEIDLNNYSSGMYFVTLITNSNRNTFKLVKE